MTGRVWVGEASGPLILLPENLLPEWSGIDVPEFRVVSARFRWSDEESRACDYDRACDVEAEVAVLAVGHGEGLVLSGGQRPTTWLPRPWGGLLVRWEHAESDEAMEAALAAVPKDLTWDAVGEFVVVGSPLELFNAAEPGVEQLMPRLAIELLQGAYSVRWAHFTPDDDTAAGLVELRRAPT